MLIIVVVLWILGALLTCKIEAILTNQETWTANVILALFIWPIVAVLHLRIKHYVGLESTAGRVEGANPDKWRY